MFDVPDVRDSGDVLGTVSTSPRYPDRHCFPMDNNGLSSPGNHINPHNEATTPPILKRLMEKKERNKRKMEALGLKPMSPTPTKTAKSKDPVEEVKPKTDDDDKKRGMLPSRKRMRPHRYDTFQSLSSQFPCRHSQLRKLVAALQAASRQSQGYIPAPLFVSGPGGSGKTDVVKECVRFVDSVSAYVDCGLLDSNGVDEVTAMILNQLICHSGDEKESLGRAKMVSSASDIDAFLRDGSSVHCVWNFGLKLREMFQNKSLSHVVIVLDNANLLEYTDTFRKASERPHYLSQLLHLPHTLRLNILFVVIARSSTPWDVGKVLTCVSRSMSHVVQRMQFRTILTLQSIPILVVSDRKESCLMLIHQSK